MNYIDGVVKALIYHNDDNAYTIIKIKVTDSTEKLSLTNLIT